MDILHCVSETAGTQKTVMVLKVDDHAFAASLRA